MINLRIVYWIGMVLCVVGCASAAEEVAVETEIVTAVVPTETAVVVVEELSPVVVVETATVTVEAVVAPEMTAVAEATAEPVLISADQLVAGTKFGRFEYEGEIWHGIVSDAIVQRIEGDLFTEFELIEQVVPLDLVTVLAPVLPSKIIAVGLNYRSHAGEAGAAAPGLFSKFSNALAGPDDPIWLFPESDNTHYEGELVIVIGKRAHNVTEAEAPSYIFGVTAGNDITERTWQQTDLQWIRAKTSDNFAPLGPYIVTGLDYNDLLVETRVNGVTTQSESTASLIHSVDKIVSYTSRYITLEPGDVIYTGTPGSTAAMVAGDVIEVEVEGVGVLRNTAEPWDPNR